MTELIEVTVTYGLNKIQKPDPTDPKTFLDISCQASGEFIPVTAPKGKWRNDIPAPTAAPPAIIPSISGRASDLTNPPPVADPTKHATSPVADPTTQIKVTIPKIEWTVVWKFVPADYYENVLMPRLRWYQGHVNSDYIPWLNYADPETVLFEGFNAKSEYTWRESNNAVEAPPVNVEMKFNEKRLMQNGLVIGHNHYLNPSTGTWQYLFLDGKAQTAFESRPFNELFQI